MPVDRFTFGQCEIVPATYSLRVDGAAVQVEPKVFELLVFLLAHRERLVTEEELLEGVWPGRYVTESVLTRAIYEARRALGDDSRRQWAIKTVHSRGYQFVAPVVVDASADETPEAPAAGIAPAPESVPQSTVPQDAVPPPTVPPHDTAGDAGNATLPGRRKRWLAAGAAAALLLAATSSLFFWLRPDAEPERERIAVVPFAVEPGVGDLAWGELALPRLLADVLTERADVVVFPANRVRQALLQQGVGGDEAPSAQVRALRDVFGVDHVLFGRFGLDGGRLRVDYDLVAADGRRRSGRALGDGPGHLTTRLAQAVARDLEVAYAAGVPTRKIGPDELVNEAFARGLNALLGGELAEALRYFETCLAADPDNGWARYEAGNVLLLLGHWDDAREAFERAAGGAAQTRDLNLAGVAASGLGLLAWRRGRLDDAEAAFHLAREHFEAADRRANLASALGNLGILADNRGELDRAREHYETALTLYRGEGERAGESASYANLAVIERKRGNLEAAAELQQRAIDLQRQIGLRDMLVFSLTHMGEIERERGRWRQATGLLEEALELARATGHRVGEGDALAVRGALAVDLGNPGAGSADLRAAREIYAALGVPANDARAALRLAAILQESDPDESRALAAHAMQAAEALGDEALALESRLVLVDLGEEDLPRVLPRAQILGDHRLLALSWATRARQEKEPEHLRVALAHAERAGGRRLQAELAVELARMLFERGEGSGIEPLLGRAEAWKSDFPPLVLLRACHQAQLGRLAQARRALASAGASLESDEAPDMSWCPHWD